MAVERPDTLEAAARPQSVDEVPSPYLDDTLIFLFAIVSKGAGNGRPKLKMLLMYVAILYFLSALSAINLF